MKYFHLITNFIHTVQSNYIAVAGNLIISLLQSKIKKIAGKNFKISPFHFVHTMKQSHNRYSHYQRIRLFDVPFNIHSLIYILKYVKG